MREASVQMYLEKKKARHFSNNNKIRYKVRKVNADCKLRMKASVIFIYVFVMLIMFCSRFSLRK